MKRLRCRRPSRRSVGVVRADGNLRGDDLSISASRGRFIHRRWFVFGRFFGLQDFSTAGAAPGRAGARGSPGVGEWWYEHNLETVFFGFAGLASIFYFLPKLSVRALPQLLSGGLAFGCWPWRQLGRHPRGGALPAWLAGLSLVGTVLTIIPIAAVAVNYI